MGEPLESFHDEGQLVAMVLRHDQVLGPGVHFLTPSDLPLQLGYMNHPQDKVINPHIHNHSALTVENTSEVLLVRSGQMLVRLFKKDGAVLAEFTLGPGDLIFLCSGAHGFKALTPLELVEVKQGPYLGEGDKRLLPLSMA
jgi:mannose-6-phosphate isomerase-like protein (cupin superfamily)